MNNKLNKREELILAILTSKRRPMTAKQIVDELKKEGVKVSRPTVARYLKILKNKGWIEEKNVKKI